MLICLTSISLNSCVSQILVTTKRLLDLSQLYIQTMHLSLKLSEISHLPAAKQIYLLFRTSPEKCLTQRDNSGNPSHLFDSFIKIIKDHIIGQGE